MAAKRRKTITFEKSSGNVFADIGFAHRNESNSKHISLYKFSASSGIRGLTQVKAGALLGIKQPHVSALMRNRSGNFSVERLMDFLIALGQDVEITVKPTRKSQGQVSIVLA